MSSRAILLSLLLIFSAGAIAASFYYDDAVRQEIREIQGKGWRKSEGYQFHGAVRKWGDWPWLMVAGGLGVAAATLAKNRRWTRLLVTAMVASTLAGILINFSRLTTGRTRPRAGSEVVQGFYGPWHDGKLLIGNSKFNSFPSGHTATAFGFAWPIVFGSPVAGILFLAGACLIGVSSLMIDAHHFSDVVVSIIISGFVGWFVWRWMDKNWDVIWAKIRGWRDRKSKID